PIVVMTTEVVRNMIYAGSTALDGLRYIVLDEVHYLQDTYRGPVWEEVIIHSPPEVDLVCLSATVSNAEEFAAWLSTVRGPPAAPGWTAPAASVSTSACASRRPTNGSRSAPSSRPRSTR